MTASNPSHLYVISNSQSLICTSVTPVCFNIISYNSLINFRFGDKLSVVVLDSKQYTPNIFCKVCKSISLRTSGLSVNFVDMNSTTHTFIINRSII